MAAAVTSSSTTTHVIHRLLRPPQPYTPALSSLLSRPFSTASKSKAFPLSSFKSSSNSTRLSPFSPSHFPSRCLSTASHFSPPNASQGEEDEDEDEDEDGDLDDKKEEEEDGDVSEEEEGREEDEVGLEENVESEGGSLKVEVGVKRRGVKLPILTTKEKKELASYANGLGKKLKSQLVGKSGVTDNLAASFLETLEANELLKIKVHKSCPGELHEVMQQLEEATGSVVVGKIGRTVIIYRPSVTKLKAEEKKQQARSRVYARKESQPQPTLLSRVRAPTLSKPGRQRRTRV